MLNLYYFSKSRSLSDFIFAHCKKHRASVKFQPLSLILAEYSELHQLNDFISRTSSSSDEASHSTESSSNQISTGLVMEASVERPESVPLDSAQFMRRPRAESEGQSRMSWTCDPTEFDGSQLSISTACTPKEDKGLLQSYSVQTSTKPDTETPPDSQNLE